jgi:hypothetical protein
LKNLAPGEALTIEFGDDARRTKRIVVTTGQSIDFGDASKEDETASETPPRRQR